MTWTCRTCDPPAVFKSWAAAERHSRAERHGRIEVNTEARKR
jgi:hypothetical protein